MNLPGPPKHSHRPTAVPLMCRPSKPQPKTVRSSQRGDILLRPADLADGKPLTYFGKKTHGSKHKNAYDTITTFNAAHFTELQELKKKTTVNKRIILRRYNSHESTVAAKSDEDFAATSISVDSSSTRSMRPEYELREFLECYSLPRVVKNVKNGRPLLLYKYLDEYVIVKAQPFTAKRKKMAPAVQANELYFPEMYPGWFSLTSDSGQSTALMYTTIIQLVQDQVCTFLITSPLSGYVENSSTTDGGYVRCTREAGTVFTLRGVFQHSPRQSSIHRQAGDRGRDLSNRYAQVVDTQHQQMFIPLTTKGCFYEIGTYSKSHLLLSEEIEDVAKKKQVIDKDCIYRLEYILKHCKFPVTLELIFGTLPPPYKKNSKGTFTLENRYQYSILIACTLPTNVEDNFEIKYLRYENDMRLSRTLLGFDSERRLLQSSCLQNAFAFCQTNANTFSSAVRTQRDWDEFLEVLHSDVSRTNGQLIIQPAKSEENNQSPYSNWLRYFKLSTSTHRNESNEQIPEYMDKLNSLDRYKDMSKLLEEKFSKQSSHSVKKSSSFMFTPSNQINSDSSGLHKDAQRNLSDLHLIQTETNLNKTSEIVTQSSKSDMRHSQQDLPPIPQQNSHASKLNEIERVPDRGKLVSKLSSFESISSSYSNNLNFKSSNSFITDRLCSEFHVKTKNITKAKKLVKSEPTKLVERPKEVETTDVIAKLQKRALPVIEDVPYSNALDALQPPPYPGASKMENAAENIYVEINEVTAGKCACGQPYVNGLTKCAKCQTDYTYVRLGSTGDDVIYSTLR